MESHCLNYGDTGAFSAAVISYLNGDEKLEPFISFPPTIAGFEKLIREKKSTLGRETLVKVLEEQYTGIVASSSVTTNIAALADTNTFTITTGHQLNILTGPLYFIYKIVTAINLAKELANAFPGKHFVPVYWMASEDHDFAEINHLTAGGETLSWDVQVSGATGRLKTDSITPLLDRYLSVLGDNEFTRSLKEIIEHAYRQPNLASATRVLVNSLFGKYGLVVIDADDRRLKQQFATVIARDLTEQNSFREIAKTSKALQDAGIKTAVNAREINFFYLTGALRERITLEEGRYYVLNSTISFSPEELKIEINSHPERFSPNVLLRPLYQEIILPNLAYIGGGAEIGYWLQLKALFDFYGVDFPILVLRNSAVIVNHDLASAISTAGFEYVDLFGNSASISKKFILKNTVHELSADRELQEIGQIFEKLKQRLSAIDATLVPSAAAINARLAHAFGNLEKKIIKAEKRNFGKGLSGLLDLRENAFPNGALQERIENFGPFFAKYGEQFIDELVGQFKPLDFKFMVLVENSLRG